MKICRGSRPRQLIALCEMCAAVLGRMLFELGYITDTDTATMREMTRRYDEAVAKGHAIPRTGGAVSNFQLRDERARPARPFLFGLGDSQIRPRLSQEWPRQVSSLGW